MIVKRNNTSINRIVGSPNKIERIDFNSGDGLKFDGVDDYVNLGLVSTLNVSQFTVSAVFKRGLDGSAKCIYSNHKVPIRL